MNTMRNDWLELVLRVAGFGLLVATLWMVTKLAHAEPIGDISLKPVVTDTLARSVPLLQPVSATILRDESGEIIGIMQVDLLAYSKPERTAREQAKAAREARRKNMSTTEKIGDHLKERWPWYVGAVASAVVVDRAASENGWLWHKSSKSSGKQAGGNLIGDETATGIANSITGDGNSITQTIIIQQGGQSGAANTGTQSELEKAN
jgi:hypothetical protein